MPRALQRILRQVCLACILAGCAELETGAAASRGDLRVRDIEPPEHGFYAKRLDFYGIPIKASAAVANEALYGAYDRLALLFTNLLVKQPLAISNLVNAGAELHIIGRKQVTTDLPEWRQDKHVPLDEYKGLTRDQRTRGMGGLLTSCGEENLLKLPREEDRYFGRDICLHEFSHCLDQHGLPQSVRALFHEQYRKSKAGGLWLNSYAGSDWDEFFAELTMWYFGTHGDLHMTGPKPGDGPEGLKKYDPEAYKLFDDLYSGRIQIGSVAPPGTRSRRGDGAERPPRDSLVSRAIVARLNLYRPGHTTLSQFLTDSGVTGPTENGTKGWHVVTLGSPANDNRAVAKDSRRFRVSYRDAGNVDFSLADLEFKDGILGGFEWNN